MAIQAQFYSENLGFALMSTPQEPFMDINNACGFSNFYNVHQQQQQQQQKPQHQQQFLMQFDQFQNSSHQKKDCFFQENNTSHNFNDQSSMGFAQSVAEYNERQRMEIDRFITLQNERLRLALQDQRKQQISQFISKHEQKIQFLLNQKEEQITKAKNRTMELEQYLQKIEIENQTWERLAKENEAMVQSLNNTIEGLKETACLLQNAADDSESCCENRDEKEDEKRRKLVCKCCNSRDSSVIMLPCRHLCSCKNCEAFLDFCPVCRVVKKGSIEVLV